MKVYMDTAVWHRKGSAECLPELGRQDTDHYEIEPLIYRVFLYDSPSIDAKPIAHVTANTAETALYFAQLICRSASSEEENGIGA